MNKMYYQAIIGLLLSFYSFHIPASPLEYRIKAAFLYNLTRMVDWPGAGVVNASKPFTLCFIGEEPFGDALLGLADKQVDKRPIALRINIALGQADTCEMLYISASEDSRLEKLLAEISHQPILTVSDQPGFGARGVMANMIIGTRKVKLEWNDSAAEKSNLIPSPALRKLAIPPGQHAIAHNVSP